MTVIGVDVRKHVDIPLETMESAIEAAGFGIVYWAIAAEWDTGAMAYTVRWTDDDADDDLANVEIRTLSYQDIGNAMARVYAGEGNVSADLAGYVRAELDDPEHNGGTIDSAAADAIIQVAIFGETVYG